MKTLLLSFFILFSTAAFADINDDLIDAVKDGDLETARTLLENGAFPDARTYWAKWTSLHIAADQADPDMMALLLEFKANPSLYAGAHVKRTPMYFAIKSNCLDCVKLLVETGMVFVGIDALEFAQDKGHLEIARYLHDHMKIFAR